MNQINKAFSIAATAHKDQLRKNGVPYIKHPFEVFRVIQDTELKDKDVLSAALLHDVKEDCEPEHWETIQKEMPEIVAEYVECLTKPDRSFGNRKARKAEQIRKALTHCQTVLLKLADNYCNLTDFFGFDNKFLYEAYIPEADTMNSEFWNKKVKEHCCGKFCMYCESSFWIMCKREFAIRNMYKEPVIIEGREYKRNMSLVNNALIARIDSCYNIALEG